MEFSFVRGPEISLKSLRLVPKPTSTSPKRPIQACQERDVQRYASRRSVLRLIAWSLLTPALHASGRVVVADSDAGSKIVHTPSGLQYYDFVSSSLNKDAAIASQGDLVTIEYTLGSTGARNGWLIEGSSDHPPLTFRVADKHNAVLKGLDEGVVGMRVGSRRRLLIPASLGYFGPNDQPIPKGFAQFQRFKNIYLNPDRPYKPDVVMDVTMLRVQTH